MLRMKEKIPDQFNEEYFEKKKYGNMRLRIYLLFDDRNFHEIDDIEINKRDILYFTPKFFAITGFGEGTILTKLERGRRRFPEISKISGISRIARTKNNIIKYFS